MGNLLVEAYPAHGGKTTKAISKAAELLNDNKAVAFITVELTEQDIRMRLHEGVEDIKSKHFRVFYCATFESIYACLAAMKGSIIEAVVIDCHKDIAKDLADKVFDFDLYLYTQCKRN